MKCFKLLCAAVLLCAVLCACGEEVDAPRPTAAVTVPTTTRPKVSSAVSDCVEVGREQTFSYTDKNDNAVSVSYRVPALRFETEDASDINAEINDIYLPQFTAAQEAVAAGKDPSLAGIDFLAYVNDDIVSLVITEESSGHALSYRVYNYNKSTGKRLNNEQLLTYLQRGYDETIEDLKNKLEADYCSKYSVDNFPDDFYYQLDLTVGDEAITQSQFFLNAEAELYAVCTEHASVGDGEFQVLIAL